jgi:hypothetical protein
MFHIDTGDSGGSLGPWLSWSSNGSAEKMLPPRSWVLRDKDDRGESTVAKVPAFEAGVVLDLETLKLGWEKDGAKGMAPERRWNPSVSQPTPRPDESKKPGTNTFAWSRALSVRCAIGGGKAATWEQGSFAAYEAFSRLAKLINAQFPGDGTLPLVRQTGVEKRELSGGSANIPILEIAKWVARPDCLKADAPVIATEPAPAPAVAKPAQAAAPAFEGADDF